MPASRTARPRPADGTVRPIASALLTAGGWALARPGRRRLGAVLIAASLVLVARQHHRQQG